MKKEISKFFFSISVLEINFERSIQSVFGFVQSFNFSHSKVRKCNLEKRKKKEKK